ncbi:hypothetical protein M0657_004042 [Pyricularia oryzae]|nr:hypothetical protein M9X92_005470 [Pyricularia oryzae]KAI7925727.1 hypothetical protein M0657_004042 [Pyricularia oryzae]
MCDFTKNYYIYTSCLDPGAHFFRTSVDGSHKHACPKGPHERYIMLPGHCPLLSRGFPASYGSRHATKQATLRKPSENGLGKRQDRRESQLHKWYPEVSGFPRNEPNKSLH